MKNKWLRYGLVLITSFVLGNAMIYSSETEAVKLVEKKQETENLKCRWPEVVNFKNKEVEKKINAEIKEIAFDLYRASKEEIEQGKQAERSEAEKDQEWKKAFGKFEWEYYVEYEVPYNHNELVSIYFEQMFSSNRQAHPVNQSRAITVNTQNGKVLPLKDLFEPNSDYKTLLDSWMKEYLQKKKNELPLLIKSMDEFKGIEPEQEFYLTDKALVIFYQMYKYTPRPAETLKIAVPYKNMETILKKEIGKATSGKT